MVELVSYPDHLFYPGTHGESLPEPHVSAACTPPQSHPHSGGFHTHIGSWCHSRRHYQMCNPCVQANLTPICPYPQAMSAPTCHGNPADWRRCEESCWPYCIGPATPAHRISTGCKLHSCWDL